MTDIVRTRIVVLQKVVLRAVVKIKQDLDPLSEVK